MIFPVSPQTTVDLFPSQHYFSPTTTTTSTLPSVRYFVRRKVCCCVFPSVLQGNTYLRQATGSIAGKSDHLLAFHPPTPIHTHIIRLGVHCYPSKISPSLSRPQPGYGYSASCGQPLSRDLVSELCCPPLLFAPAPFPWHSLFEVLALVLTRGFQLSASLYTLGSQPTFRRLPTFPAPDHPTSTNIRRST